MTTIKHISGITTKTVVAEQSHSPMRDLWKVSAVLLFVLFLVPVVGIVLEWSIFVVVDGGEVVVSENKWNEMIIYNARNCD